jgi:alpha-1,2-mannosyltransferase
MTRRRQFTKEFQEGAVRLVQTSGRTQREIAGDLGITPISRRTARLIEIGAWLLWLGLLVAASITVLTKPTHSTFHVYRDGVNHWWAAQNLYDQSSYGFVYLTSSPLFFTPFVWLGSPLDDLAWRCFVVAVFTYGLWRLVALVFPDRARIVMAAVLLLLLPCAGVNVQKSQAELAMIGWMFLGAVESAEGRWSRAALWLCLAFALKPLALVLILLYGAVVPQLRVRLALGIVVALLLPFLHPSWSYVAGQEAAMVRVMLTAMQPELTRWNEFAVMLHKFAVDPPASAILATRLVAAFVTLGLAVGASRRLRRPEAAVAVLSIAVCYLLVFNPRTELDGYMNLGAIAALFAAMAWARGPRDRIAVVLLPLLVLALGTQAYGNWIFRPTDFWLKPLLGLAFFVYLGYRILGPDRIVFAPMAGDRNLD